PDKEGERWKSFFADPPRSRLQESSFKHRPLICTTLNEKDYDKTPEQLQKQIKELEKQLEMARLKAEGYEIMIDIAENELNIPIRKKPDTK
ncbi:MAG: hypothetical protein WD491_07525, partial [Balneolales bacterium]